MSNRTQQEGRTPFTEKDFAYVPSAFAQADENRINYEWQTKLVWAIREGDPTYDVSARNFGPAPEPEPELEKPLLVLAANVGPRIPYGDSYQWALTGSVSNFDPTATYSAVQLIVEDRGTAEVELADDGTFSFTAPSGPLSENLLVDPVIDGTVTATRGTQTGTSDKSSATVDIDFFVAPPVVTSVSAAPAQIDLDADQDVTITVEMSQVTPGEFESGNIQITHTDTSVTDVPVAIMPAGGAINVPKSNFKVGENKISFSTLSKFNGEVSTTVTVAANSVSGIVRPAAPVLTFDAAAFEGETGASTVRVSGTTPLIAGTTVSPVLLKHNGKTVTAAVETDLTNTKFSGLIDVSALDVGETNVTAEATLTGQGGLVSAVGTTTGKIRMVQGVVAPPSITKKADIEVNEGESGKIAFGVALVAGAAVSKATVSFNDVEYDAVVEGPDYVAEVATTDLAAGTHPYTISVTAVRNGRLSVEASAKGNVIVIAAPVVPEEP